MVDGASVPRGKGASCESGAENARRRERKHSAVLDDLANLAELCIGAAHGSAKMEENYHLAERTL